MKILELAGFAGVFSDRPHRPIPFNQKMAEIRRSEMSDKQDVKTQVFTKTVSKMQFITRKIQR